MSARPPIRLFVDAHVLDQEFQGTRTFIREIYKVLAAKKELFLYFAANNTENLQKYFPPQDNVRYLKYNSRGSMMRLAWEIPAMLRKNHIDYAHFQYITPLFRRPGYIVTIHDVIFNEYPDEFSAAYRIAKKFLYGRSARMADVLTTVSAYSERSMRKYLDIPSGKPIHIVPNGVGPEFYAPYDPHRSRSYIAQRYGIQNIILYVSRIEPRKNHVFLLKAFLELELYRQGYYLVLLGHQSIRIPELDTLLAGLPPEVRPFVFMSDRVDDADLLEFYRAARVFVYPSRAEGFGIPPLEAAAMQIPVICSNTSGMEQFDFFGEFHVDPYDLELLKTKLIKLLKHPPSDSELTRLSGLIRERYSWEGAAEALFESIIFADKLKRS